MYSGDEEEDGPGSPVISDQSFDASNSCELVSISLL